MLLHVHLVFLLSVVTVTSSSTPAVYNTTVMTTVPPPLPENVQLLVTPDYPVAEGQKVKMHCTADNEHDVTSWHWKRKDNNGNWTEVSKSKDLTLSEPQQSGEYCCYANNQKTNVASRVHRVFIVSIHVTASDNVGVAGFVLSLLALLLSLAVVFWLLWPKLYNIQTVLQTTTTDPSKPVKEPKKDLQQDEPEQDVYMNYTSSNPAYTDLDPSNMSEDNLYSSLS